MPWQQKTTDLLIDILRITVRVVLFINLFVLSIASVYFVAKFVFFTLRWLDGNLFDEPW